MRQSTIVFVLFCMMLGMVGCDATGLPIGPGGSASSLPTVLTGTISQEGEAQVQLPPGIGRLADPVSFSCHLSASQVGPFIHIPTDSGSEVACKLVTDGGGLFVTLTGAPPGSFYRIVVHG